MSGPKTAQYEIDARVEAEREREREAEAHRRAQEQRRREAQLARLAAARAAADEAERRAGRLARLAQSAGVPAVLQRPAAPSRDDVEALAAYSQALSAQVERLETSLRDTLAQAASRLSSDALERASRTMNAAELLDAFAAQARALGATGLVHEPERRRERALKVLGRLSASAAHALPQDMEALMAEMIGAPDPLRAEALELELRLRVQRYNEEQARRERDIAEARELLASLPDASACDSVRQELEFVRAGLSALTEPLRARVRKALAVHERDTANARREQASRVLAESLRDLGYAVDGIEHTLFVEGGVAHINKAEWGDYYVRLRVDPREQTVNFNMVKERQPGDGEQRAADQAAENAWCAGLPQLMKTLEARGLPIELKRQLAAGAMPVQQVAPDAIPVSLKRASGKRARALQARTLKPR